MQYVRSHEHGLLLQGQADKCNELRVNPTLYPKMPWKSWFFKPAGNLHSRNTVPHDLGNPSHAANKLGALRQQGTTIPNKSLLLLLQLAPRTLVAVALGCPDTNHRPRYNRHFQLNCPGPLPN
jgi:hypothetical protein